MVTCKLCKKKLKQITTSGHLRRHGMTMAEYKKKFPNAAVVSQETRQAHSKAMGKRVKDGTHFVPFRDIEGFARKIHDQHKEEPVEYICIQCGKIKKTNRYFAERRKFCSNQCNSDHIRCNPNLYVVRNKRISESNKGRPKRGGYSRCNGGIRPDVGHYVRSGWEADVCRIFKFFNKPYDYEAYSVILRDEEGTISWIFDFVDPTHFLSNGLIEVKGWWDDKSKKKQKLLESQRPDLYNRLTFIGEKEMKKFVRNYRDVIPNWETRKKGDPCGA